MKRLQKALLLPVRSMAYQRKYLRLFYWTDRKLYDLRAVCDSDFRWLDDYGKMSFP